MRQPAFGRYLRYPDEAVGRLSGLLVLTLAGERISAITRFGGEVPAGFGLPATLRW